MSIKLNAQSGGSVALDAPTQTTGSNDITFKLPVADGSANQVLKTDGSKNLGWVSQPSAGITEIDLWRLTSNFSNYQEPITSGWSRNTTGPGLANIGTGLSENGGTFTFPSTGIWEVVFHADYRHNEDLPRVYGMIRTTTNNSSYSNLFEATGSTSHADSHYHHGFVHVHGLIDCTDTSNIKFNLGVNHANTTNSSNITWYGSTSQIRTYMYAKKLAET
tara:strand:+ start:977 stop:1633 length:657 start_codon:yes stop_codon:yes gene_type:complete